MVGSNAGELIAEAVLALEAGADIKDMALIVHPRQCQWYLKLLISHQKEPLRKYT